MQRVTNTEEHFSATSDFPCFATAREKGIEDVLLTSENAALYFLHIGSF